MVSYTDGKGESHTVTNAERTQFIANAEKSRLADTKSTVNLAKRKWGDTSSAPQQIEKWLPDGKLTHRSAFLDVIVWQYVKFLDCHVPILAWTSQRSTIIPLALVK